MGERMSKLRKGLGLSQGQLAELCKCSHSAIASIEQGNRMPSIEMADKLATVLGTTIDYLLKG